MFRGPQTASRPFARQQRQAAHRTVVATRHLPRPAVAAPPVIRNPTPAQTRAAAHQIATSITAAVGHGGTPQQRVQRRVALINQIQTDPRYRGVRVSVNHWLREQQKLITPSGIANIINDRVKPGPPPTRAHIGIGPLSATVNLTALGQTLGNEFAKATPGLHSGGTNVAFARAGASDLMHLPLAAPQTLYAVSQAALGLAHGDTTKAKEIVHGLMSGVIGHLVKGDVNGAEQYFRQHPVYSILELRGGQVLLGRTAGAIMRTGALGERAAEIASTKRPDAILADTGPGGGKIAMRRHGSPDVISRLAQRIYDNQTGNRPLLANHHLRRRADFESDMAAATSRTVRSAEGRRLKAVRPESKAARNIVGLISQGIVRPGHVQADLTRELNRLDREAANPRNFSTSAQFKQNRATAEAIRHALARPQDFAEAVRAARENVGRVNELEARAQALGAGTKQRMERAALFPAAQAHLGAQFSDAPFRALRDRERTAAKALRERVRTATETMNKAHDRVTALVAQHRSERGKEAHHGPVAAYYVGGKRFTLRQDAVAHAKDAGVPLRDIKRVALTSGEAKRVGELAQARRAYRSARAELKALRSTGKNAHPLVKAYLDAKAARKAAQRPDNRTLNVGGKLTKTADIKAAIGEPVAYLPHHATVRGARAFYQTAFSGRKNLDSGKTRTGEAFRIGAYDASHQAVVEHRMRLAGVVSRIGEHDRLVHSLALKGKGGRMFTWDQAQKIADELRANKRGDYVPYRAIPGSYDQARLEKIAEMQNPQELPALSKMMEKSFADRLEEPADKATANVVLLPRTVANQLQDQMSVSSSRLGRLGNLMVTAFRTTVLPFSSKWLIGNVVEAGLRLAAVGAGVNSLRVGHKLLRNIDQIDHEQALRVKAAITGGLMYGNRALEVRRFAEHFQDTPLETPAKIAGGVGQFWPVRMLGHGIRGYRDAVFAFNRAIEHEAQVAALGKYAKRELQEMTGSWAKATAAQGRALHDLARGMHDSKNIHDAAKYIDETLGQYSRFSPAMRRFVQSYAPFLPWYINSVRFVYWTLPAHHPIKTALLTNAEANLQKDYEAGHKGLPPGSLMGDIVTGSGTVLPSSRYTPFGAFSELFGGIGGNDKRALFSLVDPLFPQYKSAVLATLGLNFAGRDATTPNHNVDFAVSATMAVNSLLEAFVPGIAQARRLQEGGASPYDNSTVVSPKTKPGQKGSLVGALNRMFNPFRPPGIKGRGGGQREVVIEPQAPTAAASNDPWAHVQDQPAQTQSSDPWDLVK